MKTISFTRVLGWLLLLGCGTAGAQSLNTMDFGDARAPYPTLLKDNGARHVVVQGLRLGGRIDLEADGQPNANATGDDVGPPGALDDEDGVGFTSALLPGQGATVKVTVIGEGFLNAWIDFNGNGSWADAGEQIFTTLPVGPGIHNLNFTVPASAKAGPIVARFRLSQQRQISFLGPASNGEVEDYLVQIERQGRCDQDCMGRDFWLAFPGNYAPDPANPVRPKLYIVGNPGTTATISIAGLTPPFNANVTIPAAMFVEVNLPIPTDLRDTNDVAIKKGIHVVATELVTIYGLSKVQYSSDGYLALPTETLGTDYYVLGWGNVHSDVPELNGSQFAVVAPEDNTTVTIVPSVVVGEHNAGDPFNVVLQAGDAYQLRTTTGAPADLTGTRIIADKPIAVFGSHSCANVQSKDPFFCDYLVEQLPPVSRWAKEFYSRRLATRLGGDTFRVLAAHDNTVVSIDGAVAATIDAGEYYQTILPVLGMVNGTKITATQPVLVAQYANSSDYDLKINSDPFMALLPGKTHYSVHQRFCAPPGFLTHHINVIVPSAAAGTVTLDGAPLGGFSAIPGTGHSQRTTTVTPGVHTVMGAQPLSVLVYGWGLYESYSWPSCMFFGDTTAPVVTCPPPVTVTLGPNTGVTAAFVPCKAAVPDFRNQVTSTDNCPRQPGATGGPGGVSQDPPPGTLVGPGVHEIKLSVVDGNGNVGSCSTTFTVINPNPTPDATPVLHCPPNIIVKCADDKGAYVDYHAFATVGCDEVELQCSPPAGSLFPVGLTTVTCTLPQANQQPLVCQFTVRVTCAQVGLTLNQGQLTVATEGGAALQVANSPAGPWTDVSEGTSTFTVNMSGNQQRFYRIRY